MEHVRLVCYLREVVSLGMESRFIGNWTSFVLNEEAQILKFESTFFFVS